MACSNTNNNETPKCETNNGSNIILEISCTCLFLLRIGFIVSYSATPKVISFTISSSSFAVYIPSL